MRILGIDPGSQATGFGVLSRAGGSGGKLVHVAHGTLRPARGGSPAARLASIHQGIREVIELHRPELAVVERVFVGASVRSALVLGEARGVAMAAAAAAGLPVQEYSAREIKLAVTGSGGAAKKQVQQMVRRLLTLESPPQSDAADALAAAICFAHDGGALAGLAQSRGRAGASSWADFRGRVRHSR